MILGKGSTDGLDDTKLVTEKECFINFTGQEKDLCLSLNYNGGTIIYLLMVLRYTDLKEKNLKQMHLWYA